MPPKTPRHMIAADVDDFEITGEPSVSTAIQDGRKSDSKSLPAALRRLVWTTHIGISRGQSVCWLCRRNPIDQLAFECGHIIARAAGGPDTVANLRPICGACNKSCGTQNMHDFRRKHGLEPTKWQQIYDLLVGYPSW